MKKDKQPEESMPKFAEPMKSIRELLAKKMAEAIDQKMLEELSRKETPRSQTVVVVFSSPRQFKISVL